MKHVYSNLVIIACFGLLIAGCGSSSDGGGGSSPSSTNQGQHTSATSSSVKSFPSFQVTSLSTMPTCNAAIEGALGYATDQKKFYACDAGTWTPVDITGASSSTTTTATTTSSSGTGSGATATPAAAALAVNEWVDPITNSLWLVGGNFTVASWPANQGALCGNGFRMPTYAELTAAANDGIYLGVIPKLNQAGIGTSYDVGYTTTSGYPSVWVNKANEAAGNPPVIGIYCIHN